MAVDSTLLRLFCQNLRMQRKLHGVTQVEMAERLGISQPAYANLEAGRNAPTLTTVEKIATALGVQPSDLLTAAKVSVGS
jgi:transcriptional regulator with XRE-family HTH domain